ncbi:glycan-binding surface protein [Gelidibacter mesophilus]|uniref:glycan-binding surface protein n=1 Tax=Gelidibacter mesophilus TaxID=169050 RepID=UPI0004093922|nr:glycan-binding surface protein [Gelidibacter mesophilus]
MKLYKISYLILSSALFLFSTACKDDDDDFPSLGNNPHNIAEIISERSDLTTLENVLLQTNLDSTLRTTTTYTVFAPNDASFSAVDLSGLNNEELNNMVLNHVMSTTTADFASTMITGYKTTMATGPDGNNLSFYTNAEAYAFNGMASLVDSASDLGATNGVLHVVDGVLMPPTIVDQVMANPDYSTLAEAIEISGLTEALSVSDPTNDNYPFTLFAPNNAAFEMLMAQLNGAFGWSSLSDIPTEVLQQVVMYHVVAGSNTLAADTNGTTQTTLQGGTFSIEGTVIDDNSYTNAGIVLTDVQAVNGIVHGIDKVLLPEVVFQSLLSATLNVVERATDRGFTTFLAAVEKAGLTSMLSTDKLTVFAPNDDAFVALFATINNFESLEDFDTPDELITLGDLLKYHLYDGTLMASDFTDGGTIATIYGDAITVDLTGDIPRLKPSFEEAIPSGVVTPNIGATNGMLHEINRVLIPDALVSALGIDTGDGGLCPVNDPALVFFDWDAKGSYWGNVTPENQASLSIDGSSYGRANFQTGSTGWQDLFWRNDATFNGASIVGSNVSGYSLKFDINVIEPLTAGAFRIRFHSDAVDAFYDWEPWNETGEPFTTDGWETIEIPLSVLGVPDFSLVNQEFGMAFEGADVLLNFAIDNVRFDTPGCGGPEPVADADLVFFDWDTYGIYWGAVAAEDLAAISLDGSNYGRANLNTSGGGWNDLLWRNDATFNGASIVGTNINGYVLKFDINTLDQPISNGTFNIRFHSAAVDAVYKWAPWNDTGNPLDTEGGWITITIPLSVIGQPDFSAVNQEFGMAFDDDGVVTPLNFAMDNVRFEEL